MTTRGGDPALKMRQTISQAGFVPLPSSEEMLALLQQLRPWGDEMVVTTRLRAWADRYWGPDALTSGDADGAAQVAAALVELGRETDVPDDWEVLGATLTMLRRAAQGRSITADDPVTDHLVGFPASTMRRYRAAQEGGWQAAFARIQLEIDLGGMIRAGWREPNARRWLQRNPGKHAAQAGAPAPPAPLPGRPERLKSGRRRSSGPAPS